MTMGQVLAGVWTLAMYVAVGIVPVLTRVR